MLSNSLREKLFTTDSYHQFLKLVLLEFDSVRGYRSQLAKYAGCQPAYFSQVMAEKVELTPEQGERLTVFWNMTELEADFFFHLVLLGRAGTITLRRRLEKKLNEIRKKWKEEISSYGKPSVAEPSQAALYYSHWLHSAIHLLLTIPNFQTVEALCKHLNREKREILAVLKELELAGLAKRGEEWEPIQTQIHAPERDFFSEVHHKNWRAQALTARRADHNSAIRYTSIHSLSNDDYLRIKNLIEEIIQNSRRLIEASPEETVACLLIDYFKI